LHTHTHTLTYSHTHTHTHAYTHRHIHTHKRTHTHKHTHKPIHSRTDHQAPCQWHSFGPHPGPSRRGPVCKELCVRATQLHGAARTCQHATHREGAAGAQQRKGPYVVICSPDLQCGRRRRRIITVPGAEVAPFPLLSWGVPHTACVSFRYRFVIVVTLPAFRFILLCPVPVFIK
jgi:hypothetical protein